jgi:hypothetical protein
MTTNPGSKIQTVLYSYSPHNRPINRSFDDGLSECGLSCPPSILALDSRLDGLYEAQKMVKGNSLDTSFPCYWKRVIVLYVLVGSYVCATCCARAFQPMCWNRWHSNLVWYGNGDTSTLISTALRWTILTAIRSDRIGLLCNLYPPSPRFQECLRP